MFEFPLTPKCDIVEWEKGKAMLDLAMAIDESMLHVSAAPAFASFAISTSDADSDAAFQRGLDADLRNHLRDLKAWMAVGKANVTKLEQFLRDATVRLDATQVARILWLSDAIAATATKSANNYAAVLKRARKKRREFLKLSPNAASFLVDFLDRLEQAFNAEIEFVVDVSDHYRALARVYDAEATRSAVFSDAASLISFLKSA